MSWLVDYDKGDEYVESSYFLVSSSLPPRSRSEELDDHRREVLVGEFIGFKIAVLAIRNTAIV